MNCRDFENNISALLRNRFIDSAAAGQFFEHAENCRRCAATLEAEKILSAGFRDVIDDIAAESVSPRIEANLLAFFNSQTAAQAAAPGVKKISNPLLLGYRRQTRRAFAAAAATAATVIIFACFIGIIQTGLIFSGQNREDLRVSAIPVELPESSFPNIEESVSNAPPQVYKQTNIRKRKTPLQSKAVAYTSRLKTRSAVKKPAPTDASRGEARFFPLAEADGLVALESGQLVRVEVSVSSLIKLGVPFKADKGSQSIQAELLIGQDGIARAIRPLE